MKKNNKGFTLIELLAVIVILGILMIVAIPMVTQYIESARKDTYADTAKSYISAAKYSLINGQYVIADTAPGGKGKSICALEDEPKIPLSQVDVDNTGGKSAFGGTFDGTLNKSYVKVEKAATGEYIYKIFIVDSKGAGTQSPTKEAELSGNSIIKSGVSPGSNINLSGSATEVICKKA